MVKELIDNLKDSAKQLNKISSSRSSIFRRPHHHNLSKTQNHLMFSRWVNEGDEDSEFQISSKFGVIPIAKS